MADIIPKALYPLVPNAAGVPALLRGGAQVLDALTFGVFGLSDLLDGVIGSDPVQWGVFDAFGQPVAVADSIVSFDYRNGSKISDYPVEQGAFASYNKVANPFDVRVRMTCGGSVQRRALFVAQLDIAAASLGLYTVLTPEMVYASVNVEGLDYRRESSNGAGIIIADVYLREVRQNITAAYSAPKAAASADPESQGQVQISPVTQSVIKAVNLGPLK